MDDDAAVNTDGSDVSPLWRAGISLVVLAAVGACALGLILAFQKNADFSIAMMAGGGLLVLAVSLIGIVIVARTLGISTAKSALGLPGGSVRALLAFSLVIVFVVIVSWSLNPSHASKPDISGELQRIDNSKLPDALTTAQSQYPAPKFMVTVVPGPETGPDAGKSQIKITDLGDGQQYFDLQKQIITIIATLLVAVVSFYFGGKSASEATTSMNEAVKAMSDSVVKKTTSADTPQANGNGSTGNAPTFDGVAALGTQIAAIAAAAKALVDDLGDDPMALLTQAATENPTIDVSANITAAQSALSDLTAAVAEATVDAQRADALIAPVDKTTVDTATLTDLTTRLNAFLTDATTSKTRAATAADAFKAAHAAITEATAKG